jgi:hypothetical protein
MSDLFFFWLPVIAIGEAVVMFLEWTEIARLRAKDRRRRDELMALYAAKLTVPAPRRVITLSDWQPPESRPDPLKSST